MFGSSPDVGADSNSQKPRKGYIPNGKEGGRAGQWTQRGNCNAGVECPRVNFLGTQYAKRLEGTGSVGVAMPADLSW